MFNRFIQSSVFIFALTSSFAQTFEGRITYENKYKSKLPNVTDQQFTAMMGSAMEYAIKGGNYKSTTNGTFLQWQLYINKDNKLYTKMASSASLLYYDGAINTDEIIKAEINKSATEILGHKCDELILTCKSGVQKYYFNNKLKVDAKLFENHKYGNWSEVLSKSGSIPLKIVIDNAQFTIESVATEIKPMALEDKIFQLPADVKIEKSPY